MSDPYDDPNSIESLRDAEDKGIADWQLAKDRAIYLPQWLGEDRDGRHAWFTTTDYGYFHNQEDVEAWIATRDEPDQWSFEEVDQA